MAELTRFTLDNGGMVIVQTPSPGRVVDAGLMPKKPGDAAVPLRAALDSVTGAASEVLAGFQTMFHRPDEIEIQLGVSFDASFGMVIANASSSAHLDVKLRWSANHEPADDEEDAP